jgi:uncharacterized protein YegL
MISCNLIPVFVMCDESENVSELSLTSAIETLKTFNNAIVESPEIEMNTQLCISGFSTEYELLTPLARTSEIHELLSFKSGGICNLGIAAEKLAEEIQSAVTKLKGLKSKDPIRVLRPILIVLLGSNPEGEWTNQFESLLNRSRLHYPAPVTCVYVLRAVDENIYSTIERIVSKNSDFVYRVDDWSLAMNDAMSLLRHSLMNSESQPSLLARNT